MPGGEACKARPRRKLPLRTSFVSLRLWSGFQLARSEQGGVLREGVAPQEMVEPVEVGLHDRAVRFGLGDGVAESGVADETRLHVLVLQATVEFETVGRWNALVGAAGLNERRRFGFLDVGH